MTRERCLVTMVPAVTKTVFSNLSTDCEKRMIISLFALVLPITACNIFSCTWQWFVKVMHLHNTVLTYLILSTVFLQIFHLHDCFDISFARQFWQKFHLNDSVLIYHIYKWVFWQICFKFNAGCCPYFGRPGAKAGRKGSARDHPNPGKWPGLWRSWPETGSLHWPVWDHGLY